jgi:ubiquinol-cytochrome c reductase cytochrome b subunit
LFESNCAVCHVSPTDKEGKKVVVKGSDKAPDLTGFGTKEWNLRFLSHPDGEDFFARTSLPFKKKKEKGPPQSNMQRFIDENFPHVTKTDKELADLPKEEQEQAKKDKAELEFLADWLARHPRKTKETDKDAAFQEGVRLFADRGCTTCHKWEKQGAETGPNLTGYGDADWIRGMIMAPGHHSRYGRRNAMPAFRELQDRNKEHVVRQEFAELVQFLQKENDLKPAEAEKAYRLANLSDIDREIIIRYLTRDYHVVYAGDFAPPKK